MAHKLFSHKLLVTPAVNPKSLWQIRVPTNGRVLLHAIEFEPGGSTPAAAPLEFDFGIQAADGTYDTDDSANLVKEIPAYSGSILSTVFVTNSVEPSTTTPHEWITVHQQARLRWTPPTKSGMLILDTATRWALRNIGAVLGIPLRLKFVLEE